MFEVAPAALKKVKTIETAEMRTEIDHGKRPISHLVSISSQERGLINCHRHQQLGLVTFESHNGTHLISRIIANVFMLAIPTSMATRGYHPLARRHGMRRPVA
jgi:hypothetical protein